MWVPVGARLGCLPKANRCTAFTYFYLQGHISEDSYNIAAVHDEWRPAIGNVAVRYLPYNFLLVIAVITFVLQRFRHYHFLSSENLKSSSVWPQQFKVRGLLRSTVFSRNTATNVLHRSSFGIYKLGLFQTVKLTSVEVTLQIAFDFWFSIPPLYLALATAVVQHFPDITDLLFAKKKCFTWS